MTETPRFAVPLGSLSRRVHGAERELREREEAARLAAAEADLDGEVQFAASLRGKARAYAEAGDILRALDRGRRLPKRPNFTHTTVGPEAGDRG